MNIEIKVLKTLEERLIRFKAYIINNSRRLRIPKILDLIKHNEE